MIRFREFVIRHKSGSLLILIIIISFVLMSVSSGKHNFMPKRIGTDVFSVFQIAVKSTSNFFTDTINSINELKKLKSEHDLLLKEVHEYQVLERDIIELKQENFRLKKQLDFKTSSDYNIVPAEIIAQEPGNIFNSIIINKGTHHGVKNDMPVIAYQDGFQGLVGKVLEAGTLTSKIMPIFDNSSYVASRMLQNRYEGLMNGSGDKYSTILMHYVTKNAIKSLKEGDLVITSGMQSIYPRGIYIGRIRDIDIPEWQTSLVLEIEPVIDFSRLEYVFVLTGDK